MKINRTIAAVAAENPRRCAGTYEAALEITVGGQTGQAIFFYEYDKRDVMSESLYVDPAIEEAAKAECPEEGPSVLNGAFNDGMKTTGDPTALEEARAIATARIYDFD